MPLLFSLSKKHRGSTLIEILIACCLFTIMLIGCFRLHTVTFLHLQKSWDLLYAQTLADNILTQLEISKINGKTALTPAETNEFQKQFPKVYFNFMEAKLCIHKINHQASEPCFYEIEYYR